MWTNILLRTESLAGFLNSNGNVVLSLLGIKSADFDLLGTPFAVIFGLFVTYVPFMVMPIFNSLEKIDKSIEEAALDLGLTHTQKFFKVILPSISTGIATGAIMAFTLSLDDFVISYFTCGKYQTLPIVIYNMTKKSVTPDTYALSTIIFFVVFSFVQ